MGGRERLNLSGVVNLTDLWEPACKHRTSLASTAEHTAVVQQFLSCTQVWSGPTQMSSDMTQLLILFGGRGRWWKGMAPGPFSFHCVLSSKTTLGKFFRMSSAGHSVFWKGGTSQPGLMVTARHKEIHLKNWTGGFPDRVELLFSIFSWFVYFHECVLFQSNPLLIPHLQLFLGPFLPCLLSTLCPLSDR